MNRENLDRWVARKNAERGQLKGYECPICNNEGIVYFANNDWIDCKQCDCMQYRKSISASTFESYKTDEPWQKAIKKRSIEYAEKGCGWFFIGGQVGAGKTLICRAIVGELSRHGEMEVMQWIPKSRELKSVANDLLYKVETQRYKNVDILLIDDFFYGNVTDADKTLARDIIDKRYLSDKITIINSEKTMSQIASIDEGTAGRIKEKAGQYVMNIDKDIRKDMRI